MSKKLRSLAVPRRREEKDQQQRQQQDQRRSRSSSSSSSPTTRISTLVLSIATCWLVFTALVVFRNAPETHRLVDGIAATEKHLLDEVVGRYDSIANHHHPLAVALKHAADAKGVGVGVDVDGPPKPEVALEPPRPEEIVPREAERPRDGKQQLLAANHDNAVHPVAGLDCADHGGPADPADAKEMVYWRDVPEDNAFVSPFSSREERRYLTFEPDGGGWNNIRMSMETVLALAVATGRVLVLPPSQRMYLLGQTTFNFADFFPLQELAEEHAGLEIISTERFLLETMGKVRDSVSLEISYPPGRKTRWDGDTMGIKTQLGPWLRSVSLMPDCAPDECIFGVPSSADPADAAELARTFQEILMEDGGAFIAEDAYERFVGQPIPVDAPTRDRLTEFLAGRSRMLVYDAKHQTAPVLHFHGKSTKVRRKKQQRRNDTPPDPGGRLLVHFYAFLFFQDWRSDTWTKRFVRDHLRYVDHVQCAAARVVHALRTTHGGTYDSFHIRRGDFQYKKTRVEATEIVAAARDVIPEGRVVYVGTDERDKSFFKPLIEEAGWNVFFLDDFLEDVVGTGIDKHYYGMIDQLVVSRGDHFFGCWFSTFTGYIMRLRGYHTLSAIAAASSGEEEDPDLAEALAEGALPRSYFYALKDSRTKMHEYWPIKKAFYAREFPTAWRKIDAT